MQKRLRKAAEEAFGRLPINVAFSPDRSPAYVVVAGDGTVLVIDTATNEVLDLDPAPGVQGIVFDATLAGTLQSANVIGTSPNGNRLYISNYTENTVTALSFVEGV